MGPWPGFGAPSIWGLGSICSFLLKNHGFLQGLGFSFLQKPAFLQVFRVKGAVKPRVLQVFRVSAPISVHFSPSVPFFWIFQSLPGRTFPV